MKRGRHQQTLVAMFGAAVAVAMALWLLFSSSTPFPEIDRSKLQITLERTGCFGTCPSYRVTIDGRGNVVFTTEPDPAMWPDGIPAQHDEFNYVAVTGTYQTRVDPAQVDALVQEFRRADFFALNDAYVSPVTDNPTYVLTIDTGNGTKTVVDYVGEEMGMPRSVTRLQLLVDRLSNTRRWIEGTADVLPILESANVRPSGAIGERMALNAAERGELGLLQQLGARGVRMPYRSLGLATRHRDTTLLRWLIPRTSAGTRTEQMDALSSALRARNLRAFDMLTTSFTRPLSTAEATRILAESAEHGVEPTVRRMLSTGADVNATPEPHSFTPALAATVAGGHPDDPPQFVAARRRIVDLLIASGADVRWVDPILGVNVLYGVGDPIIARDLIARGANVNHRDFRNEHVLISIYDEASTLVFLGSGVRLRATERDQLVRRATQFRWHRVLAELR
jgi:hypothetical protein